MLDLKDNPARADVQARRTLRTLATAALSLMLLPFGAASLVLIIAQRCNDYSACIWSVQVVCIAVLPLTMLGLSIWHVVLYRRTPQGERPVGVVISVVLFAVIGWLVTTFAAALAVLSVLMRSAYSDMQG